MLGNGDKRLDFFTLLNWPVVGSLVGNQICCCVLVTETATSERLSMHLLDTGEGHESKSKDSFKALDYSIKLSPRTTCNRV